VTSPYLRRQFVILPGPPLLACLQLPIKNKSVLVPSPAVWCLRYARHTQTVNLYAPLPLRFGLTHGIWGHLLGFFDVAPPRRDPCQGAASASSRGRLEATAAVLMGAASIRTMKRLLAFGCARRHPPGTSKTPWPHRAPAA